MVADPKQSIYGWRGAEPELVHRVARRFSLDPQILSRSYRSSQIVLDLVNRVFEKLTDNRIWDGAEGAEEDRAIVGKWASTFLAGNQLSSVPDSISNLKVLNLNGNQLSVLPSAIENLTNLTSLSLARNQLTDLPREMSNLPHLEALDLTSNQISAIPEVILALSGLNVLVLGDNPIDYLRPAGIDWVPWSLSASSLACAASAATPICPDC